MSTILSHLMWLNLSAYLLGLSDPSITQEVKNEKNRAL